MNVTNKMTKEEAKKYISQLTIEQKFEILSENNKLSVNRLIETLAVSQLESQP